MPIYVDVNGLRYRRKVGDFGVARTIGESLLLHMPQVAPGLRKLTDPTARDRFVAFLADRAARLKPPSGSQDAEDAAVYLDICPSLEQTDAAEYYAAIAAAGAKVVVLVADLGLGTEQGVSDTTSMALLSAIEQHADLILMPNRSVELAYQSHCPSTSTANRTPTFSLGVYEPYDVNTSVKPIPKPDQFCVVAQCDRSAIGLTSRRALAAIAHNHLAAVRGKITRVEESPGFEPGMRQEIASANLGILALEDEAASWIAPLLLQHGVPVLSVHQGDLLAPWQHLVTHSVSVDAESMWAAIERRMPGSALHLAHARFIRAEFAPTNWQKVAATIAEVLSNLARYHEPSTAAGQSRSFQFVLVSNDPAMSIATLSRWINQTDLVAEALIITPRETAPGFEGLDLGVPVQTVTDDVVLGAESVRFDQSDHVGKNWLLRSRLPLLPETREEFVMIDDDSRPIGTPTASDFVTTDGRFRACYFADLESWTFRRTSFDYGLRRTLRALRRLSGEQLAYDSHQPQLISKLLLGQAADWFATQPDAFPPTEWDAYFNFAISREPYRFHKEIYHTLVWPGTPWWWKRRYRQDSYRYENYYPSSYTAGMLRNAPADPTPEQLIACYEASFRQVGAARNLTADAMAFQDDATCNGAWSTPDGSVRVEFGSELVQREEPTDGTGWIKTELFVTGVEAGLVSATVEFEDRDMILGKELMPFDACDGTNYSLATATVALLSPGARAWRGYLQVNLQLWIRERGIKIPLYRFVSCGPAKHLENPVQSPLLEV